MPKLPHLAGIMFALIFGLTFMFSKTVLEEGISPIGLISYRYLLAFLTFELIRRLNIVKISFQKADIKILLTVGLLQPVAYFLFETYGLARTTSAEAGMMIALIPIFATIFSSVLLKEKPTKIQVFFILLSVSGVIFIQAMNATGGIEVQTTGLLLLFMAVISAALFNIASRSASKSLSAKEITYFMMFMGAIVFNSLYVTTLIINGSLSRYVSNLGNLSLILPIMYLGIIASIGGFFLINYALSKLEAHVISIYANIATIVAVIAGALYLQESIESYHYLGALMIVSGVYGTVRTNRRNKARLKI